MTDLEAIVATWIEAQPGVSALAGARVYASRSLPAGYNPAKNGPAILFVTRGGPSQDQSGKVHFPSMQFQSFAANESVARQLATALFDAINDRGNGKIKKAWASGPPQLLIEPSTEWPFVLQFFDFIITE